MKKIVLWLIALVVLVVAGRYVGKHVGLYWYIANPKQQNLPLPAGVWAQKGPKGEMLTQRNASDADYKGLSDNYQAQIYLSYCGVASGVMALRALGKKQLDQENFFPPEADKVRSASKVFYGGMSLPEASQLLALHAVKVSHQHAAESDVQAFRQLMISSSTDASDVVLVNYSRKVVGQKGGGHFSPVAAYDEATDRVLILDTAAHKYPPAWVAVDTLYKAMNTLDSSSQKSRGWVVVKNN